jgi:hypothetical protein
VTITRNVAGVTSSRSVTSSPILTGRQSPQPQVTVSQIDDDLDALQMRGERLARSRSTLPLACRPRRIELGLERAESGLDFVEGKGLLVGIELLGAPRRPAGADGQSGAHWLSYLVPDFRPSLTAPTDKTTKSKPAVTAFHVKTRFKLNWSSQGDAISHRPITASQILDVVIADTESRISEIPIATAFHDAAASIRIGSAAWRSTQGEIRIQTTRIARRGSDHRRCVTTLASLILRGNLTQNLVMMTWQYFDVSQVMDKNPTGEQGCSRGLGRRRTTRHCDRAAQDRMTSPGSRASGMRSEKWAQK